MNEARLPLYIDPYRLAASEAAFDGCLLLKNLSRLRELAHNLDDEVVVSLRFKVDEQNFRVVYGQVQATLAMDCQRCMQTTDIEINAKIALCVVKSDEKLDIIPSHYEALVTKGEPVVLSDLIEDEILLNMPQVPMHLEVDCAVQLEPVIAAKRENPFTVLKALKQSN